VLQDNWKFYDDEMRTFTVNPQNHSVLLYILRYEKVSHVGRAILLPFVTYFVLGRLLMQANEISLSMIHIKLSIRSQCRQHPRLPPYVLNRRVVEYVLRLRPILRRT
jgi:hypothetical protein